MTEGAKSRRQVLEDFVAAHPDDAFARYGLAMECVRVGEQEAAVGHFRELLSAHPRYVAGYFHFAQLLARLARVAEAKEILSAGIAAAKQAGDAHAAEEMAAALAELG
jgi:tetratricopeptide (TPR) repeat protein